jgi:hypothetical protein
MVLPGTARREFSAVVAASFGARRTARRRLTLAAARGTASPGAVGRLMSYSLQGLKLTPALGERSLLLESFHHAVERSRVDSELLANLANGDPRAVLDEGQ